jgi:hypothetical protein
VQDLKTRKRWPQSGGQQSGRIGPPATCGAIAEKDPILQQLELPQCSVTFLIDLSDK